MFKFLEKAEKKKYVQLFLLTIITHILIVKNNFTFYSDDAYVLYNPIVKHFSIENIRLMFTTYFDGHYHPLTLLSLAFNYAMSGENAISYNITNLLIHSCNVVLIFVFVKKLFKRPDLAFGVALIWAIHPIHVESVARITDRKDTQYVFFLLVSLINYLKYRNSSDNKFLIYTAIAFLLSLLSKGQALILPLLLLLIDWYNAKNKKANYNVVTYFIPISITFAWIAYRAQLYTGYLSQTENISFSQIIFYPSSILSNYVCKLFVPVNLSAQYTIPKISEISGHYYLLLIPVSVCVALIYLFIKNQKIYFFGLAFYLITVSVMLRFVPIAENFMPDRYNYLASLGFCIIIVHGYFSIIDKFKSKKWITYLAYVYILFFSATTFLRVTVWQNGLTIWQDAYKNYPADTDILQNLGEIYLAKQQPAKAKEFLQKAIMVDSLNILARFSLYKTYVALLDNKKAKDELFILLKLKPQTANQTSNQSTIFSQFGLYDRAIQLNNIAVQQHPLFIKFRINDIGYQLYKMNFDTARNKIDNLLALDPYCANVLYEMRIKANMALFNTIDADLDIEMAKQTGSLKQTITEISNANKAIQVKYINYNSSDFNVLIESGKELFNQKAYVNALLFFKKCEKIEPIDEAVFNNICACYYNLSQPLKVKEYYSKIIANNFSRNKNLENYLSLNAIDYGL